MEVRKLYKKICYGGKYYYSYSLNQSESVDRILNTKWFSYLRGWDKRLHLFLMLGYIVVDINGNHFPQVVCYHIRSTPIYSFVSSSCIIRVLKRDILNCCDDRLCLISLDRLYYNKGHFFWNKKDDNIYFIPLKATIKQSPLIKNGNAYLSISPLFSSECEKPLDVQTNK